jgi:hypothetical protein
VILPKLAPVLGKLSIFEFEIFDASDMKIKLTVIRIRGAPGSFGYVTAASIVWFSH